jgi:hypothetical protein
VVSAARLTGDSCGGAAVEIASRPIPTVSAATASTPATIEFNFVRNIILIIPSVSEATSTDTNPAVDA